VSGYHSVSISAEGADTIGGNIGIASAGTLLEPSFQGISVATSLNFCLEPPSEPLPTCL